jgi:predicted secreted protein
MKLPIRNKSDRPLTIFVEPLCDTFEVPVGGRAIVRLEDGQPHSIDIDEAWVTIWDGGSDATVEVVTEEDESVEHALGLVRVWLYQMAAKDDAHLMDRIIADFEIEQGYVEARARVFAAFHQGFTSPSAESPSVDDAPRSAGLTACRRVGATAALLNLAERKNRQFPGKGMGPLDTDTVRTAFERAAARVR